MRERDKYNTTRTAPRTGAIEGMPPSEQLSFDGHGTVEHERRTAPACARAIARKAESIVRATRMGPGEGASEHVSGHTVMARLCLGTEADDAHAPEPNAAIAALSANTPCKWQPIPVENLAAMPRMRPEEQVQIGAKRATTCAKRQRPAGQTEVDQFHTEGPRQRFWARIWGRAEYNGCAEDAADSGRTQQVRRLRTLSLTRTAPKGALAGSPDPALYLSAGPDRSVETVAECVWTGRRRWLW